MDQSLEHHYFRSSIVKRFVAALGLINIDIVYSGTPRLPAEGEEVFSSGFDLQFGGGVPATLINLHKLGVPVRLGTYLGKDLLSDFARNYLDKAHLDHRNYFSGSTIPLAIPLTITSIISTANDRTFVSYRPEAKAFELTESQVYELYKGCSIAYISLGYDEVWRKLRKDGAILVLDSHWREDLSLELYADAFRYIDYFTPNEKEACAITGQKDPRKALEILGGYLERPLVKLGSAGCLFMENGKAQLVPAYSHFRKVDATGAGDAFLAGFMYGIFHNRPLHEAVALGNLSGGKCVSGIGCLTEAFDESELLGHFKTLGSGETK